ncbi:cohesin domain-containing protein [Cohnella boryungensis]|uniref:Cohesin domain-containing protein n=1 Tax=Cohnella boryungensis TaxID=768479 RepID=A0ABV8S6E5_9BACL
MKKVFGFIFSLSLLFALFIPASSVSAYTGGLTNGKLWNIGSDSNSVSSTTPLVTDNDELTYYSLPASSQSQSINDTLWISFDHPVDITSYKIKAESTTSPTQVYFIDVYGQATYFTPDVSGTLKTINKNKISKISFQQGSGNTKKIYELDFFGNESTFDTPTLTGALNGSAAELSWNNVLGAPAYSVKRSTTPGGPYQTIATVTGITYADSTVEVGQTYYYVVTTVNGTAESVNSNEVSVSVVDPLVPTLNVVIDKEKIKVGEQFTSDIVLQNVSNIYAEDFKINYDSNLLNYVGFEEIPGYKVYNQPTDEDGKLRFIIASQGEQYGINGEQVILKLKFTGKETGIAKVDALECRIADTESEYDLGEESCTEDTIEIEGVKDVNRTGEYTLVDLAIDGFYYGKTADQTDHTKHDADQAGDTNINDDDLVYIVSEILKNPNYPLNA